MRRVSPTDPSQIWISSDCRWWPRRQAKSADDHARFPLGLDALLQDSPGRTSCTTKHHGISELGRRFSCHEG